MKVFSIIAVIVISLLATSAFGEDCGKKTSEHPANSSTSEYVDGGKIKSLRGYVLYPNGEKAELLIVEVYHNNLTIPIKDINYVQVGEILKNERVAVRHTELGNRFCFKNLSAGNYMLVINSSGKFSQFSTMYIFITVAPKSKENTIDKLEVKLELAI